MPGFGGYGAGRRQGSILDILLQGQVQQYLSAKNNQRRKSELTGAISKIFGDLPADQAEAVAALALNGMPISNQYLDQIINKKLVSSTLEKMDPTIAEGIRTLPFNEQGQAILKVKLDQAAKAQAAKAKTDLMTLYESLPKNTKGFADIEKMTPEQIYNMAELAQKSDPDIVSRDQLDPLMNMFFFGQLKDPRTNGDRKSSVGTLSDEDQTILNQIYDSGRIDGPLIGLKPIELSVVVTKLGIKSEEAWRELKGEPVMNKELRTAATNSIWAKLAHAAGAVPLGTKEAFGPDYIIQAWIAGDFEPGGKYEEYVGTGKIFAEYLDPASGDIYQDKLIGEAEKIQEMTTEFNKRGKVGEYDKRALQAIRYIQAHGYDNMTDLRRWLKKLNLVDLQVEFIIGHLPDIEAGDLDKVIHELKEL